MTDVLFDSENGQPGLIGTPASHNHTVVTNGSLVVIILLSESATDWLEVKVGSLQADYVGGATFAANATSQSTPGSLSFYACTVPTAGTYSVSYASSRTIHYLAESVSVNHVNSIGSVVSATGSGSSPSQAVTCPAGRLAISVIAGYRSSSTGANWSSASGGTAVSNLTSTNGVTAFMGMSTRYSAGADATFTANGSTANMRWLAAHIVLAP